jgi:hypothetical protein
MNELEQIEQQFNFKYPELYKKLYDDGMLNSGGAYGQDWYGKYYAKLAENPPMLFFGFDFELLKWDRIVEEIKAFKDPNDYRQIKPEFQFVPFGRQKSSDLYVFQFDKQNGADVPITLLYHDDTEAIILAKNLQDFIFRDLLEDLTSLQYSCTACGDFKTNSTNILRTHRPYLKPSQVEKLEEIYSREMFEYEEKSSTGRGSLVKGLITQEELEEVLKQEIGFEGLDSEFEYMG